MKRRNNKTIQIISKWSWRYRKRFLYQLDTKRCELLFRLLQDRTYGQIKIDDDKPLIPLMAPTGSAAFQIGELTLHAALQFNKYNHLSYEKNATLVTHLCDEISMV